MDIEKILSGLKADRDRLDQAIAALEGTESRDGTRTKRTYTKRAIAVPQPRVVNQDKGGGITPAGRRRLSEMMKKRWAERRKKKG